MQRPQVYLSQVYRASTKVGLHFSTLQRLAMCFQTTPFLCENLHHFNSCLPSTLLSSPSSWLPFDLLIFAYWKSSGLQYKQWLWGINSCFMCLKRKGRNFDYKVGTYRKGLVGVLTLDGNQIGLNNSTIDLGRVGTEIHPTLRTKWYQNVVGVQLGRGMASEEYVWGIVFCN